MFATAFKDARMLLRASAADSDGLYINFSDWRCKTGRKQRLENGLFQPPDGKS